MEKTRVIVDTTVWIDYLNGVQTPQTDWLDTEVEKQRLGLTDLILCEILQGVKTDEQATEAQRELMKFEVMPMSSIELAVTAAQNYRKLRAKGRTVRKTVDCLIATFCLTNGFTLLHNDRDFDPFEETLGLLVIHP
jgi:predicted nucleic acid-binding protein